MKLSIFTLVFILFTFSSCRSKKEEGMFFCGVLKIEKTIFSKVETIKIGYTNDSLNAQVEGIIYQSFYENDTLKNKAETLAFCTIILTNETDTIGFVSNVDGYFQKKVKPGKYQLNVLHILSNTLVVRNISLKSNESTQFDLIMGQGHGTSIYSLDNKGVIEIVSQSEEN